MSRLLSLCCLLLLTRPLLAQTISTASGAYGGLPGEQRIIPASPSTAGLGTYGSLPVDLNSGAVSISVPLVDVQCRSLSVPVSLSYRTTGIRVEEIASWVGLGWSLNAGGLITRTIRGQPDETPDTGYLATFKKWYAADTRARVNPTQENIDAKKLLDKDVVEGRIDVEADTYSISVAGQSATATMDADGKMHLNPFREWIVGGGPASGAWSITLPDGVRYDFAATEMTAFPDESGTGRDPGISAWHLTSITSANGLDVISFGYLDNATAQVSPISRIQRTKLNLIPYVPQNTNAGFCPKDPDFSDGLTASTSVTYYTKYLTHIRTATTTLEFISDSQRPDLDPTKEAPGRRLTAVVFTDARNVSRSRRFDFLYQLKAGRMHLESVQQVGQPAYRFEYEQAELPSRFSNAQDHWGFFNGAANGTLIPTAPAELLYGRQPSIYANADRSTNALKMDAGILKSIQYPTGGKSYFEYEANRVLTDDAERQDSLTVLTIAASGGQMDAISQAVYDREFSGYSDIGIPNVKADVFTLPLGATNVTVTPYFTPFTNSTPKAPGYFIYKLDNENSSVDSYTDAGKVYPPPAQNTHPTTLAPGKYVMFTYIFDSPNNATLDLRMHVTTGKLFSNRAVGGIRIKRMKDYGRMGDSLVTTYDYTRYNDKYKQRTSSGRLFFEPRYFRGTPCGAYIIAASDARTMSYAYEGYHMGYDEVTVTKRGLANGKTTYKYLNSEDSNARSLVLTEQTFDAENMLVKQVDNGYSQGVSELVRRNRVFFRENLYSVCLQMGCEATYYIISGAIYETESDFYYCHLLPNLASTREQVFPPKPGVTAKPFQTYRTYTYATLPTGQPRTAPTKVRQWGSTGDVLTTYTTYPQDYEAVPNQTVLDIATAGVHTLLEKHVLTTPIEAQTWRRRGADSVIVGGFLTHYQGLNPYRTWQLEISKPLTPAAFVSSRLQNAQFKQDPHYAEASEVDQYDTFGNIRQQHRKATRGSYLWDEHGTQLLAKTSQASYNQIGFTSFEPASPGRWSYDPSAVTANGVTGNWSYGLGSTAVSLDSLPAGKYNLVFWATAPPTVHVNGTLVATTSVATTATASGSFQCYRYQGQLPAALNTVSLSGAAGTRLDELRLYPATALMQSYTHDPLAGITSQTDATGRILRYEYDSLGRLLRVRDEQNRILTQNEYHYSSQP